MCTISISPCTTVDGKVLQCSASGRGSLCTQNTATTLQCPMPPLFPFLARCPQTSPHSPVRLVCRCLPAARAACSRSLSARMAMARCCRMPKWSASSSAVQLRQQGGGGVEGWVQGSRRCMCKPPAQRLLTQRHSCPDAPLQPHHNYRAPAVLTCPGCAGATHITSLAAHARSCPPALTSSSHTDQRQSAR